MKSFEKILAFIWGLGGALVILLPVFGLLDLKLALSQVVLAGLLGLGAWLVWQGRLGAGLFAGAFNLSLWLYALALVLAWLNSPFRQAGQQELLRQLSFVLMAWLAAGLDLNKVARRWVVRLWLAAGLALCLYALMQRAGMDFVEAYARAHSQERAMGSFGNPTFLAGFINFFWPLGLAAMAHAPLALSWLGLALSSLALLATGSRAGLLATVFQCGLLLWLSFKLSRQVEYRRRWLWAGLGAALGLVLLAGLLLPRGFWLRPTLRLPLWQASVHLFLQRPLLGWGPGSFTLALPQSLDAGLQQALAQSNQFAEHPHNFVLSLLCESGLLGGLAFAWLLGLSFKSLWQGLKAAGEFDLKSMPETQRWQLSLFLGVAGLLAQNFFDRNLKLAGSAFFFWAALGWGNPLRISDFELPQIKTGIWGKVLGLLVLFLAGVELWLALQPVLAYRQLKNDKDFLQEGVAEAGTDLPALRAHLAQQPGDAAAWGQMGDDLAKLGRFAEAAQAYQRVLQLDPSAHFAAINLGNCYFQLKRLDDAAQAYQQALRVDPNSVDAHFDLGYVYYYQRKMKEAVGEFDTVLKLDPNNSKAIKMKEQIVQ